MSKLSELIAAARLRKEQSEAALTTKSEFCSSFCPPEEPCSITESGNCDANANQNVHHGIGKNGEAINYNSKQWEFIQTVLNGKSCILIGAAGTGKTTSTRGAISSLLQSRYIPPITESHKHLPIGNPSIVCVSYTRRAVMNLKKAMPSELKNNCITIHKLLEYAPNFYEVYDEASGEYKKTMRFEPSRNQYNPLPASIRTIIIDESSMVSVALYHEIYMALDPAHRAEVQFIFLGDIQQLPPVFGSAILGFKMLKLPVIELTEVYRQALESPIIRLAHRILSGNPIQPEELTEWNVENKLKLHPWKKRISADPALQKISDFFRQSYDNGAYNPKSDMILIPFNKACGTDELNKVIANHIARKKSLITYEVVAGYNKHYFSIGEKILYEKEDAEIISIKRNPVFAGKHPQAPSIHLDYWGCLQSDDSDEDSEDSDEDIDAMLELIANQDIEDRVREASHIITVRLNDSEREIELKSAAEINSLIMAYALTIHKSQGSEWQKVFVILHQSHNTMIQRELLYTACTRAREELYVICEPDSFVKGINGQRIKGNTLEEKSQFFKGKLDSNEESFINEII